MRALIIIILCAITSSTSTAAENELSLQQIEKLITVSGIELHINQIPNALQQSAQSQSGPARLFVQPLMQSLQKVFQPDEMLAILSKDLLMRLDVPTLLDSMTWYNSDNGRKIVAAQKSILRPEVMEKVGQALANQNTNTSPERKALVSKLAASNHSVDIALNLMVTMQASFMSGLSNMVATGKTQSFDQLRASFDGSKELMREQISKQLLVQQSVIYQGLSGDTLTQFLTFSDSPSGQKLFRALDASLNETMKTVALRIPEVMQAAAQPPRP